MLVIVVRQTHVEEPDKVIVLRDGETERDAIVRAYPTAEFASDRTGMFTIPDGAVPRYTTEYLFDLTHTE